MLHLHTRAIWAVGLTTMIAFACSSGSSDDHTSDASVYAADGGGAADDGATTCFWSGLGCGTDGGSQRTCVNGTVNDDACLAYYCACSGKVVGGCGKLGEQLARIATKEEVELGTCDPAR